MLADFPVVILLSPGARRHRQCHRSAFSSGWPSRFRSAGRSQLERSGLAGNDLPQVGGIRKPDPADRCVFILSPVKLPHGLPTPDFSKMADPTLRAEAQQHWRNLEQAVIAHNPHALVNSAASLSEALLRQFLRAPGPPRESLGTMLDKLRLELDANQSRFSPLSYHFMQGVRVMHQPAQHPGKVVATGRTLRPGLALTIAEDMIEVLTSLGLVQ
jgi:hypothetical protein